MKKNFFLNGSLALFIVFASCSGNTEKKEADGQERSAADAPAVVIPGNDGSLMLTAENGVAIGTEIKYMPEWKALGWFRSGDKVEWTVDVKKAGTYRATLEWSVSDEEAGKEYVLEAGSERITGTVEKSGSWETFESLEIGTIALKEGKQVITFKPNQEFDAEGALLDLRHIALLPME
ncbi:MAG: hypothetical protein KIT80_20320 [Chitinophagaceae bacterium]|nr:hypothetical protein [Chitinophagaceae bacterium]MCW5929277.1 hypothetical protein [Chitinophagaceae bacterium]